MQMVLCKDKQEWQRQINTFIEHIHERRDDVMFQGVGGFTDEEVAVLLCCIYDNQAALKHFKWSVLDRLIKDGFLIEVWRSGDAHYGEPDLKLKVMVDQAKQSSNRI